ncbi:hypothetical protein GGD66_006451 [Bradyrhizobium sp. CIR48]|uniref:hypothetical protein n=1 Tax=Bradyrhizobium sp. CIR48 TaxID=2663840 RepID=UPI0016061EF8|nr:hypothetical protein [Bradyrhizobium sp. CIR48]MBB4427868.1 hypothetical protein [Bradyrhizobium sp. CIR48]
MNKDKPTTKKAIRKKIKLSDATAAVAIGMTDKTMTECMDIIRRYRGKCSVFRQRFLDLKKANRVTKVRIAREFVKTLEEMEYEARVAAQNLRVRLPTHKPLVQSEIVTYLAGRAAREA